MDIGLDRYEVIRELGSGGFATVYLCRQTLFKRDVAVKVLHNVEADDALLRSFERECESVGRLQEHKHVISVFDAGLTSANKPYLVMEFAPGGSLLTRLKLQQRLPEPEVLAIGAKVADALQAAHDIRVLHRDIKPGNILVAANGEPLLADFGIAKLMDSTRSGTSHLSGTIAHTAPEVLDGQPPSPASDVYSLASTLATLLLGRPPHLLDEDVSLARLLARIVNEPAPDFSELGVSAECSQLLAKALSRDPVDRPVSAAVFSAELGRMLSAGDDRTSHAVKSTSPQGDVGATSRHRGGLANTGRWPTASEYAAALQRSDWARSAQLTSMELMTDGLGLPMVATGQNAAVFLMARKDERLALRVLTRQQAGSQERYQALSALRVDAGGVVPHMEWIEEAVEVAGVARPALVMPWFPGKTLDEAVRQRLGRPSELRVLAETMLDTLSQLERSGLAHGDLQVGNIIVDDVGQVSLVDWDGVYLPELAVAPSEEVGHPNFQHPGRTLAHWGWGMDAFSGVVIYLSLLALAADSTLWRFNARENLIFTADDFREPERSEVWQSLDAVSDPVARKCSSVLRQLCAASAPPSGQSLLALLADRSRPDAPNKRASQADQGVVSEQNPPALDQSWWQEADDRTVARVDVASSVPTASRSGGALPDAAQAESKVPRLNGAAPPVPASASGGPSPWRSLWAASGRNGVTVGAAAGLASGVLASVIQGLIVPVAPSTFDAALLVGILSALLAASLSAWRAATQSAWREAASRGVLGLSVGAVAGLLSVAGADGAWVALADRPGPAPIGALVVVWAIVAVGVGVASGILQRSTRAVVAGVVGGALGGALGGLVHGAVGARAVQTGSWRAVLIVDGLHPGTLVAVCVASMLIGASIGLAEQVLKARWLTVIEGPLRGRELLVTRPETIIGSASTCGLVLSGDEAVHPSHAVVEMSAGEVVLRPVGTVRLNGLLRDPGNSEKLANGDVIQVGGSFIRFRERQR